MLPRSQQLRDDWGVCRVCASPDRETILDLGDLPLANAFRRPSDDEAEPMFPLGLVWCPRCHIVQIPVTVDPDTLFREYVYTPSASTTWRRHCAQLSEWTRQRFGGTDQTFVVEPASNDGCLLREVQQWTPKVLGIEPARNIAAQANADGVPTLPEFFSLDLARGVRDEYGPADVIIGTNVLAHVPDIVDFVRGAVHLLTDDGSLVIEAPYLLDLVDRLAYDTIYHEHVSYLSVSALDRIFEMAGLELVHVQRDPIHGGSIRFVGSRGSHERDPSVRRFLDEELERGYGDGTALRGFAGRVDALRGDLHETVAALDASGTRIAAYGATAKGNTLLSTSELGHDSIRYVVDKNPLKQGLLTPGTHIPVVGPSAIASDPVEVLLLLAWNLEEEVVGEQGDFLRRGGRFLIPVPSPHFAS